MAQNLRQLSSMTGIGNHVIAVLDGRSTRAADGAAVLEQLRKWYKVDNDQQKVLTESAGTREGLTFALRSNQQDIAATWANDPVAVVAPNQQASALGFTPYGSAGAGQQASRDVQNANSIVNGMQQKGYNTKAPYIDPNSGHGTVNGLIEGLKYLRDKKR
jgi:hypothetical protein